ncbi:MAG TPA: RNA polymerase sigma factor [Polyangiaceae bacterium]|nr:RNA polymerase sigma factor [Polyangiaceae bacterium]
MQATRTFIDAPLGSPRSEAAAEEDTDLVKEALAGNRWAEEALYYRHVRGVTRVVLRLLSRSSEVEDVVQDTFVIAFGDLAVLADPAAFRHWLIRIAVRQVHRRFRRRKLLRLLGLDASQDDQILAAQADPKAGPETRVLLGEVDRILAKLPIRARVAWVLRMWRDRNSRT